MTPIQSWGGKRGAVKGLVWGWAIARQWAVIMPFLIDQGPNQRRALHVGVAT